MRGCKIFFEGLSRKEAGPLQPPSQWILAQTRRRLQAEHNPVERRPGHQHAVVVVVGLGVVPGHLHRDQPEIVQRPQLWGVGQRQGSKPPRAHGTKVGGNRRHPYGTGKFTVADLGKLQFLSQHFNTGKIQKKTEKAKTTAKKSRNPSSPPPPRSVGPNLHPSGSGPTLTILKADGRVGRGCPLPPASNHIWNRHSLREPLPPTPRAALQGSGLPKGGHRPGGPWLIGRVRAGFFKDWGGGTGEAAEAALCLLKLLACVYALF